MTRPVMFLHRYLLVVLSMVVGQTVPGCRPSPSSQTETSLDLIEATITEIHDGYRSHSFSVVDVTRYYLDRIAAYDSSTGLNAIVVVNPLALRRAEELDDEYARTGVLRPLHGIPIIVKDNYDTHDLQTTGGILALKGSMPPDDAFQVSKLREAGAIVLAKSNMAEWAFSPYHTESSIAGTTRNPYDLTRVPAGSSGGTAAAVAANLGVVGLGTDTGNSIRGPSSHNALVGIRSTMGLTSRDGIIPLFLRNDVGGPMARTVEDAVRVLEVIAGYDPSDPITEQSEGHVPENYTQFLDTDGLQGAKLGVFRRYIDRETTDPGIKDLTEQAIKDLEAAGAEIVDPFDLPNYETLTKDIWWCQTLQYDFDNYLASLGPDAKYKSLEEIVSTELYLPEHKEELEYQMGLPPPEELDPPCSDLYSTPRNNDFRERIVATMDAAGIDAIIYPTWSNIARKIGDMESPAGDNSQHLSPHSGLPAITVPTGYTPEGLPGGMTFIGRLFAEPDLIRFVYAYEQATQHRRPSDAFPNR